MSVRKTKRLIAEDAEFAEERSDHAGFTGIYFTHPVAVLTQAIKRGGRGARGESLARNVVHVSFGSVF